jgi:hypothetical protein
LRELGYELYKNAKMIALAPTKLVFGSFIDAYGLQFVQALVSNEFKAKPVGRWLSPPETAECADLLILVPMGSRETRGIMISGWSTRKEYSTLPGDHGFDSPPFHCPLDGTRAVCGSDRGSYARLKYKPSQITLGRYTAYHTVFMNWYHDDAWFHSNPREVHMTLYFRPPDPWRPDPAKLNESVAASLKATDDLETLSTTAFADGSTDLQRQR